MLAQFYQNVPQHIDPQIFSVGPVSVGWYGVMWLAAFATVYFLLLWRIHKGEQEDLQLSLTKESLQDVILYTLLGAIVGGRLGYVLFYDLGFYLQHPLDIMSPYSFVLGEFIGISGMSYHGGALGVVIAVVWYARKHNLHFWKLIDFVVPAIPLGYFFGRIGNFLNGELYGRVTDKAWGMHFDPVTAGEFLRHPSQLYEAIGEGLLIFVIVWTLRNKKTHAGTLALLYLFLYGAVRFIIEFFRSPDVHIGLNALDISRGQMLSLTMIVISAVLYIILQKKK